MFRSRTVFVVGAGASYELGLPIGDGLAQNISGKLNYLPNRDNGDDLIAEAMQSISGARTNNTLKPWYEAANRISQSMPLALSIDNYLHTHSKDDKVVAIGKLAIARCILEAERNSDLYVGLNKQVDFHGLHERLRTNGRQPSWHNTFFKMLTDNVKREELDDVFSNVSIITFNYDRCIEHYLTHAFCQFMNIEPDQAKKLVGTLEIIHPYGKVGDYFGETDLTEYGAKIDRNQLVYISKQIRTFTEQVIAEDTIEVMATRLSNAKNIVFLGFSFGEMNLNLMKARGEREAKTVIGTALWESEPNKIHIDRRLRQVLKLEYKHSLPVHLENRTCSEIIKDFYREIIN